MVPNAASEYTSLRIDFASLSSLKEVRCDDSRLHSRLVLNLNIENSVAKENEPFYVRQFGYFFYRLHKVCLPHGVGLLANDTTYPAALDLTRAKNVT
jgi:hypothetical protein